MANTIKIKRSSVPGKVPAAGDLDFGELAINYADGNLFFKDSTNSVATIASTEFVSVTGNVTGGNLQTSGNIILNNVSSDFVGFVAPDTITANVIYYLPSQDGNNGEFLRTDGSGNLSWTGVNTGTITIGTRAQGSILIDTFNGFLLVVARTGTVPVPVA